MSLVDLYTVVSGETFNNLYNGTRFYKILKSDLTHHNFRYKMGLNIDTVPFNPIYSCHRGGLYFCEESKVHLYIDLYGNNLAQITIPNDARVYVEQDKFKADKLIIEEITQIEHVPYAF